MILQPLPKPKSSNANVRKPSAPNAHKLKRFLRSKGRLTAIILAKINVSPWARYFLPVAVYFDGVVVKEVRPPSNVDFAQHDMREATVSDQKAVFIRSGTIWRCRVVHLMVAESAL